MKNIRSFVLAALVSCVFSALIFSGCSTATSAEDNASGTTSLKGNSDANLNNLGLSAVYNDTLYYVGADSDYDIIYKADENGEANTAVVGLTGYIQYLNIVDDTFYFVGITYDSGGNGSESVFSADLDGEERTCLFSIDEGLTVVYMTIVGDTIFYAASSAEGESSVTAVNLEDNEEKALFSTENAIQSINIYNSEIYYVSTNTIYRCALDGSDSESLYTGDVWVGNMIVSDDMIYFVQTQTDATDSIYALPIDGGDPQTLLTGANWLNYLNINGQTLYYADHTYDSDDNLKSAAFYALDIASGKTTKIGATEEDYAGFDVCGNDLIYHLQDDAFTAKLIPLL